jgi:hypothetical protein
MGDLAWALILNALGLIFIGHGLARAVLPARAWLWPQSPRRDKHLGIVTAGRS